MISHIYILLINESRRLILHCSGRFLRIMRHVILAKPVTETNSTQITMKVIRCWEDILMSLKFGLFSPLSFWIMPHIIRGIILYKSLCPEKQRIT